MDLFKIIVLFGVGATSLWNSVHKWRHLHPRSVTRMLNRIELVSFAIILHVLNEVIRHHVHCRVTHRFFESSCLRSLVCEMMLIESRKCEVAIFRISILVSLTYKGESISIRDNSIEEYQGRATFHVMCVFNPGAPIFYMDAWVCVQFTAVSFI